MRTAYSLIYVVGMRAAARLTLLRTTPQVEARRELVRPLAPRLPGDHANLTYRLVRQ